MSNILLINLKRFGDIYSSASLIRSIKDDNPHAKVSLLIYKEFENAAINLKDVENIYTIDRKQIITLKSNPLFNNSFSLNEFVNSLASVKGRRWERVINYSNCEVSTYISSYLKSNTESIQGIHFNNDGSISNSNEWSLIFNDILTEIHSSPLTFIDNYHLTYGIERSLPNIDMLKLNSEHRLSAEKNFSFIRESEKKRGNNSKIIGFQLVASHHHKQIPIETTLNLIEGLITSNNFFPVILHAPIESERVLMTAINEEFNNGLISVEADFTAVPSVLEQLDILITPDTSIKHIADIVGTKTLEISLGEAPIFKQGTINSNSIIMTPRVENRSFKKSILLNSKEEQSLNQLISANDIISSLNYLVSNELDDLKEISNELTIYRPSFDNLGVKYNAIAGSFCTQKESYRALARTFLLKEFSEANYSETISDIQNYPTQKVRTWLDKEKIKLSEVSKDLLGTLRNLLLAKDNKQKVEGFISSLDQLLTHCKSNQLASIPCLIFRARLENTIEKTTRQNYEKVEGHLYKLKDRIQSFHELLKEVDEGISSVRHTHNTRGAHV